MRRRTVLVVTPAARFGSWAWIEKALERRPDLPAVVVGYGTSETAPAHVRFLTLPALIDYGKWGPRLAERRYLALNLLYYAPIVPLAWLACLIYRPRVLLANGVNSAGFLGPLTQFGPRLLLAFHGSIENAGERWHRILRRLLTPVSLAFVNSAGSADDLAHVIDRARIEVVEHWADDVFFQVSIERRRPGRLRVLFVGRLDTEKFAQCLRVCARLGAEGVTELRAVGSGPLAADLQGAGLEHVGYVSDKRKLATLYADSDVVWAPADVTYIAIPGAEGLAAGCPLIVSATPAVFAHARAGQKVPESLLPDAVARVVDRDQEAEAVLRDWAAVGISLETRERCRAYAEERYSTANISRVAEALGA